jgi:hypothetical protein
MHCIGEQGHTSLLVPLPASDIEVPLGLLSLLAQKPSQLPNILVSRPFFHRVVVVQRNDE